jgi:hypothetical protein
VIRRPAVTQLIGEEFLYCVKAAGYAGGGRPSGGHAASGRSHPPHADSEESRQRPSNHGSTTMSRKLGTATS